MTLLIVLVIIYLIFFTKIPSVGKLVYTLNNKVERLFAGLNRQSLEVDGETMYFLGNQKPSLPTMVLIHGFSADKDIWLKFAKHASKDFNLIIPDMLGHGDMPYSENVSYSAYSQASYLVKLLTCLKISGELTLVGNSMGGMIAAIIANNIAGHINTEETSYDLGDASLSNIVLMDPAGARSEFAISLHTKGHNPFLHTSVDSAQAFYKLSMHKPPFLPLSVIGFIGQENYIEKQAQYSHMFKDFFNPDEFFNKALDGIEAKVTLIWGKQDQLIPVKDAEFWRNIVKVDNLHLIDDIGHLPMLETPKLTYWLCKDAIINNKNSALN